MLCKNTSRLLVTLLVVTLLATALVGLLNGPEFLPHGAVTLQILIWSITFGWINSLTNYVLIALNRQRYVLLASGARVVFTIAMNLLFVGAFSYVASAWILVGGELLLVLLFYVDLRRRGLASGGIPAAPIVTDYVYSPQLGDRPFQLLGVDPFAEAPFRNYLGGTGQAPVVAPAARLT